MKHESDLRDKHDNLLNFCETDLGKSSLEYVYPLVSLSGFREHIKRLINLSFDRFLKKRTLQGISVKLVSF